VPSVGEASPARPLGLLFEVTWRGGSGSQMVVVRGNRERAFEVICKGALGGQASGDYSVYAGSDKWANSYPPLHTLNLDY